MVRIFKYAWFVAVMSLTNPLPDFTFVMRLRGWLLRPAFRRCGRNFQVCSRVMAVYTANIEIGADVYIAYGSWLQGYGGIELQDEVMLGPYTILASNNHSRRDRSYRFGPAAAAPIVLERGSWTGAHVVITAGVQVGAGAACAAGAVVTKSVPADAIVGGVPAQVLRVVVEQT